LANGGIFFSTLVIIMDDHVSDQFNHDNTKSTNQATRSNRKKTG